MKYFLGAIWNTLLQIMYKKDKLFFVRNHIRMGGIAAGEVGMQQSTDCRATVMSRRMGNIVDTI